MTTQHFTRFVSVSLLTLSLFCCTDKSESANDRNKYELLQEQVNNLQGKMDSLIQALTPKSPGQKNNVRKSKKKLSSTATAQQSASADNNYTIKSPSPEKAASPAPQNKSRAYTRRVGAICCDGSRSSATGRGACSHHGGVCEWLYQ